MKAIHLRDAQFRDRAVHFLYCPEDQLTDDMAKVTCKTCKRMMERRAKHEAAKR